MKLFLLTFVALMLASRGVQAIEYGYSNKSNMSFLDEAISEKKTVVHCVIHLIPGKVDTRHLVKMMANEERSKMVGRVKHLADVLDTTDDEDFRMRERLLEKVGNSGFDANTDGEKEDDEEKEKEVKENSEEKSGDTAVSKKEAKKKRESGDNDEDDKPGEPVVAPSPDYVADPESKEEAYDFIRSALKADIGMTLVADCATFVRGNQVNRYVDGGFCNKSLDNFKMTQYFKSFNDSDNNLLTKTYKIKFGDVDIDDVERLGYFLAETHDSSTNKLKILGLKCEIKVYSSVQRLVGVLASVLTVLVLFN